MSLEHFEADQNVPRTGIYPEHSHRQDYPSESSEDSTAFTELELSFFEF